MTVMAYARSKPDYLGDIASKPDYVCAAQWTNGEVDVSGYTKLFGSILNSTVWQEDSETRVVWITMLALCDAKGFVWAAVPGLARQAGVSCEATERALAKFLAPDPYSRTKDHEGRRIVVADGGWTLLNYEKYRDRDRRDTDARRKQNREAQARYRAKSAKRREVESFDGACDNLAPDHVYDELEEP